MDSLKKILCLKCMRGPLDVLWMILGRSIVLICIGWGKHFFMEPFFGGIY